MVNRAPVLILCALFITAPAFAAELYTLEKIERVISGNTFQLESGKKIQLIGVDAHEDEPNRKAKEDSRRFGKSLEEIVSMGKETTQWVKTQLEGRNIFLKYDKKQKGERGEELVYAYLYDVSTFYGGIVERHTYDDVQFEWWQVPERGGFIFLNATIIKAGYATPAIEPPNSKYGDELIAAYQFAKENHEGLWNVDYFALPCTEEGGKIGECAGCIVKCCGKAEPIFDLLVNGKCRKTPQPGSGGYCSHCGNKNCETEHLEDRCNCPRDCK